MIPGGQNDFVTFYGEKLEEEQKQKEELEHNLKEIQSKKNKEEKALTNRIESLERKLKEKEQEVHRYEENMARNRIE